MSSSFPLAAQREPLLHANMGSGAKEGGDGGGAQEDDDRGGKGFMRVCMGGGGRMEKQIMGG